MCPCFRILSFFIHEKMLSNFSAPFDVALSVLTIMTIVIVFTWSENYGDKTGNWKQNFTNALTAIRNGNQNVKTSQTP